MKAILVMALALWAVRCDAKGNTNTIQNAAWSGDLTRVKGYLAADPKLLQSAAGAGALTAAAKGGHADMVAFLIAQGADVNEKGFFEMTPLAAIASILKRDDDPQFHRYAEIADILLDHGAEVDAVDDYQKTALLHAVECEQRELTQVLLDHGAKQDGTYNGVSPGMTPLHMAIRENDRATVQVLLKFTPPLDVKNRDDETPLVYAEVLDRTELAAMIRPLTGDTNIIPSRAQMRALATRAAEGDPNALDELTKTGDYLLGLIPLDRNPYPHVPSPYTLIRLNRMRAASGVLGEEVGRGNAKALQVLKQCLGANPVLRDWAVDACSTAAAAGSTEALNILLAEDMHGQMNHLLVAPAEANVGPAVDYFIDWMNSDKPFQRGVGEVMLATNAVAKAAAKGNEKAKVALQQFIARFPPGNN